MSQTGLPGVERATIIIEGQPPTLEAVLLGKSTEPPFDKTSFEQYAKNHYILESLEFFYDVEAFRASGADGSAKLGGEELFRIRVQRLFDKYIAQGASNEVNISAGLRKDIADATESGPVNYSVLDEAQQAVLTMVSRDQYARYTDDVILERRVYLSKAEALWWRKLGHGLTIKEFFSFPSPINSAESRLHNCVTALLLVLGTLLYYFFDIPWIFVFMAYGFLARVISGPRLDPQAFFVLFVLRPLVVEKMGILKNEYVSSSPKRFSQACGLVFASLLVVFSFLEINLGVWIVSGIFFVASFTAALLDYCIACHLFNLAISLGILPETFCEECAVKYVKGTAAACKSPPGKARKPQSVATPPATSPSASDLAADQV